MVAASVGEALVSAALVFGVIAGALCVIPVRRTMFRSLAWALGIWAAVVVVAETLTVIL